MTASNMNRQVSKFLFDSHEDFQLGIVTGQGNKDQNKLKLQNEYTKHGMCGLESTGSQIC